MLTKEYIAEMEERCRRMFPFIDTTAVNIIMAEIQNLKKLLESAVVQVEIKEEPKVEVKTEAMVQKPRKPAKTETVEKQESQPSAE